MSKGIIYVMTTIVPGLVKMGITKDFEGRMYFLESNGYRNITGLKRNFAIEVEDYDEKEKLLSNIFAKSKIEDTELYAIDVDLVIQLLSSFEGRQIYPEDTSKTEEFLMSTYDKTKNKVPNGIYYMKQKLKAWNGNEVKATMEVKNGEFIVKKGSIVSPIKNEYAEYKQVNLKRNEASIKDNVLQEDVRFSSPSLAGTFVTYGSCNGWSTWKTEDGRPIDCFRNEPNEQIGEVEE